MNLRGKKLISVLGFAGLLGWALLTSSANTAVPTTAPAAALTTSPTARPFAVFPESINLETSRDFQSIVAVVTREDGVTLDVTRDATFTFADPSIAKMDGRIVRPVADGATYLTVTAGEHTATVPVVSRDATKDRKISFRLDVMPVFMRAGCNSGGCHGAARGQDGFMLSLFGYDPAGDFHRITREIPNRRVNLAMPADSLLITKSTNAVPHTGGQRLEKDGHLYNALLRWVEAGAPNEAEKDVATPVALEILPEQIVLEGEGATQQMIARVKYSDGTDRDVTNLAVFMTNNDNSATVTPDGLVTAAKRGEAFVMARFATFTVGAQAIVIPKDIKYQWPDVPENNYIDSLVHEKLKKLRIVPSELADDQAFVRRLYIDLVGQLPTPEEFDRFIVSTDPAKREKLVDDLLTRKEFVELWVMKFAELLKIRSNPDVNQQPSYKATLLYYNWLQERLADNVPMDRIVKDLLTSEGGTFRNPATNFYQVETDQLKLAENTAQVFMGIRMQCAQCHNHPFDRWTQNDYYGFASFFTQVGRKPAEDPRETVVFNSGGGEVPHPLTKKPIPAKFLGGDDADVNGKDRRAVLAEWLASKENPYFAKNLANIIWSHFMGVGIIDPVDDVRISNPATNPQLLDALGAKFAEYDYDFRRLVRDICTSRAYQLSTRTNDTNATDDRNFSHALIRRIRAEVLLDCIAQVTEAKEKFRGLPLGARAVQIADGRTSNFFLRTFGRATRETVCSCEVKMEPNLSQALHLLNGDTVGGNIAKGKVVPNLLKQQKLPPEKVIEELYVRCLTRPPTESELKTFKAMLDEPGANKEQVLTDLFWALLNSQEFMFNH